MSYEIRTEMNIVSGRVSCHDESFGSPVGSEQMRETAVITVQINEAHMLVSHQYAIANTNHK